MPNFKENLKQKADPRILETLKPIQIDETISYTTNFHEQNNLPGNFQEYVINMMVESMGDGDYDFQNVKEILGDNYHEDDSNELEAFEARIKDIFGSKINASFNTKVNFYLEYLKKEVSKPCYLTGTEDFEWEEEYVLGMGSKSKYENLKKNNPSYTDIFLLVDFLDKIDPEDGIQVKVTRPKDGKTFTLSLIDLEANDENSRNYELIEDYSLWFLKEIFD